jgi:hypothetical protein
MLTTIDNPHDPFTNYDEWYEYDRNAGYHTPSFLARIAVVSDEVSDEDQANAIEEAVDEIVNENVLGLYRKVQKEIT